MYGPKRPRNGRTYGGGGEEANEGRGSDFFTLPFLLGRPSKRTDQAELVSLNTTDGRETHREA